MAALKDDTAAEWRIQLDKEPIAACDTDDRQGTRAKRSNTKP